MKRTIQGFTAVAIFVLGGCSSFNNSFNTYHIPVSAKEEFTPMPAQKLGQDGDDPMSVVEPKTPVTPAKAEDKPKARCDVSPYPIPGHPPELPDKALRAAAGDVYALERLERMHIDELRAYISERRRLQREAKDAFLEKCEIMSK
jgi:hypothetical protein